MAIEGSLQSVDIQDIAQLLNINRSTGLLHIENDHLKGILCYRDGEICNASVEGMSGYSAAYVLLSQSEGHFHFEIADHQAPKEIQRSIHDLVLEAARRQDTIKKIRSTIKHDSIVFLPLVDVRIPQMRKEFSDFEIHLLSQLDGQTEIKDIIQRQKESDFEIFYVIYELEKRGFLKRVDIYRVLEIEELKKLFGKNTDAHVSPDLCQEWIEQSMTFSDCKVIEIRTQKMLFGQVPILAKSNVPEGKLLLPKALMVQFEVRAGDKVLIKPILNPS